ncbi:MAG: cytochrome C [Alphaproteobacteria bacterium]|nr:cytochrome C [Alphaproteobacteria bacterium]
MTTSAQAVPSFARQTGMACEACHTVFPELTPFGRRFKLNAFVLTTKKQVTDINEKGQGTLSLSDIPPLSIMLQASSAWTAKNQPDSALANTKSQNGQAEFPQQLSLFYAGKIADNFGAMLQMTYQQNTGSIGIDNSDMRYANHTPNNDFLYGFTLNNNPTVQDVWNSTPAWGAPFMSPTNVPTPAAKVQIANLGQTVAGLGAYGFYRDRLYMEVSGYRSAPQGKSAAALKGINDSTTGNPTIQGVAPYWRAAYEFPWGRNSLSVGTFGMMPNMTPNNVAGVSANGGAKDRFKDLGLDTQYQFIGDKHTGSLLASWVHENQKWKASYNAPVSATSSLTDYLDRMQVTGTYYYQRKFGGSIGYTSIKGRSDFKLYNSPGLATNASGSASGSPNSQFETLELDYLPFLNTKILAQYTFYNEFNGGTNNYDGFRHKASGNNTTYIGLWTSF